MLKLILGGVNSNKNDILTNNVIRETQQKNDVLVIVPDQYSFEYDKELYSALGAKAFNSIEVIAFNRLCEKILKLYGNQSDDFADSNARLICMFNAISKFRNEGGAAYYKKALSKVSFCSDMLELADDLRLSGVDAPKLREAGLSVGGTLCDKTEDITKILELYSYELEKRGLKDNSTLVNEAMKAAGDCGYFENKCVFIHEFSDFSYDEYGLISVILSQAKSLTVSLIIDDAYKTDFGVSPFKTTIKTKSLLTSAARSMGHDVITVNADESCFESKAIEHISKHIFRTGRVAFSGENDGSEIVCAKTPYGEIEYAAARIRELISLGFSYNDMAVITRNTDEYFPIIESVFERYDIPFFADVRQSVFASSFTVYVLSVFDCVMTREYRTENILRYIKSPLSGIDENDAAALEEYVLRWGVDRELWENDFIGSVDETKGELDRINKIRRKVIAPLQKFKESTSDKTADEICIALYELLNDIKLSDKTFGVIARCSESDDSELIKISRGFKQIWTLFLSAINSVYQNMKGERITLKRFCELIRTLLSTTTISNPPQSLDAVCVANAQHSRLGKMRICFVVGLNDGLFPSTQHPRSLITDKEREHLKKSGASLANGVSSRLDAEHLITYIALSTPSSGLIASYCLADTDGSTRRPSSVVGDMLSMLGESALIDAEDMPASFYCKSEKSAFFKYFDYLTKDRAKAKSVRSELMKIPDLREKLNYYDSLENPKEHKLSEKTAEKTFFSKDLNLSATRTHDYYKCPFNYYCKNGLKIYPVRKIEISSTTKGSLIHFCLQELMCYQKDGKTYYKEDFESLTDDEIKSKIHTLCTEYSNRSFGGGFAKTKRFYASLTRFEESVFYVVKNIISELQQSLFKPCAFEYDLTKSNGESLFKIKIKEGVSINIRGKIDRVDVYDTDGGRYIRITDYKSNDKKLKLEELYHGLNMQMIIYLLALISSDNEITRGKNPSPAGILYMPAKYIENCVERAPVTYFKEDLEKILDEQRENAYRRDGLLVDNVVALSAMDQSFSGLYTPVKLNKDGGYSSTGRPMDIKLFEALEEFVKDKIVLMGESLQNGRIEAKPVKTGKDISCKYCDYWSVCGNYNDKDPIIVTLEDKKLLENKLEEMAKRGESNDRVDQ